MPQFSLIILDNTISNTNADVSFAVTCDDPPSNVMIKHIELDLPMLADIVEWSGVVPVITTPLTANSFSSSVGPNGDLSAGQIRFSFMRAIKLADYNNRIEFSINDLYKKEGEEFPPSAEITFKLKPVSGEIPADYTPNTIYVAAKKPVISSFRINPSIIRPGNDITITYQTTDASTCELKDSLGKTMDFRTVTDQTKPFNFSINFGLGSPGTSPCPPFYLRARNGAMEALENTVANVITSTSPQWQVLDNFSWEVRKEIDGNVIYVMEQYTLLDLVLNEYDDKMWAIMQKKTDPAAPPSIWNSRDGLSWLPHIIMVMDDNDNLVPVMLTIPSELAHCPCLHFGQNELYFVGGSKADISVCKNTITKINLDTGFREDLPPAAIKPRCMHACVIYPDANGNDNIWVIGGADKNGNGLNDVWRFDGSNWTAVPTGNNFPKRCQFAATVQTDLNKNKTIWIGAGAARYNGSTLNDLWVYSAASGWRKVKVGNGTTDLNYGDEWLTGASICYLRTNKNSNTQPSGSDRYIISSDISWSSSQSKRVLTSRWILGVDIGNNYYDWVPIENVVKPEFPSIFESVRNFATATIGFNGCVWTVILAYISKGNVAVSKLYYSCPEP